MATHDYNIANQTGADFRADLNNALLAIVSNNSNATAPSTTYAYQLWVDTANNVLKLRNSANSDWITTGISITTSNSFTGDITGNSATATALATARTINGVSFDGTANISFNSDSVSEGSSNLYFTNERVDDQVNSLLTAGSGISLTYDDAAGTLTIANTNSADITSVVAGDGLTGGGTSGDVTLAVSVDDSSIEIDSDTLRVKASGITNAMLAGSIANSKLANSSVTINSQAIALGGSHTFDSDDIGEGSTNLYFTNARARGTLSIGSEGTASGNGAIAYNSSTGVFTYTPPVISGLTGDTDDISEGSSNLYYTDARSNAAIDARVTNTFINNLSGVVADTATALATARSIALSGDVTASGVNFDGTGDITLSTTIAANSVALGTDTTGNYVSTISGTTNEIEVSGSGSETASVIIGLPDNVTIAGNLTVNGTTTSVNTQTLEVEDPLIKLAKSNSGADSVDIGFYGLYDTSGSQDLYAGLFRDASDSGKFKLFKDLQAEPTTTVNTSGTGYAVGTLVSNLEGDVTGNITGNVSGTAATVTGAAQTNITSVGTLTGLTVSGDANFDSGTLFVDVSNNQVGIGTTDPSSDALGSADDLVIKNSASAGLTIKSADSGNQTIALGASSDEDYGLIQGFYNSGSPFIRTSISSTEVTRVTSSGLDVTGSVTADSLTVDDITINGSTISDAADLSIDVGADLTLDAGGGDIILSDDGTIVGTFSLNNNSGDFYIRSRVSDKDMLFRGNDGGSEITALTLDMSNAGRATFNENVTVGGNLAVDGADFTITANVKHAGDTDTFFGFVSDDTFRIVTSGSEALRVTSAQRVGIGTTSPSHKLQVNDNSAGNTTYAIVSDNNGASGTTVAGLGFANGGSLKSSITAAVFGNDFMTFNVGGSGTTERMRIDSSGNVGIGTDNPSSFNSRGRNLVVNSDGDTGITISANTSSSSTLLFADSFAGTGGTTAYRGSIEYDHATDHMAISTASAERMRIDSSGNLGLGTTSPNTKLEVLDANGVGLRFGDIASTPSSQTAGFIGMSTSAYSGINGDLVLIPRTSTTSRILLMEGNVGINTTTAKEKLDVSGAGVFTGDHATGTNAYGAAQGVMIHASSSTGFVTAVSNGSNDVDLQLRGLNGGTANANQLVLDSEGGVGIGTASPSSLLHLNSGNRDLNFTLADSPASGDAGVQITAGASDFLGLFAGSSNGELLLGSNGAEKMRIDSSGNVGIGETSPSAPLDIAASSAGIELQTTDNTSFGYVNFGDPQDNNIGQILYDHGSNYMRFQVNNSEKVRIDASGNVGIGTTSPSKILHLKGSAAQIRIEDSDGTNQIADISSDSGDMFLTSRNNTSHGEIVFRRFNGTSVLETARIDSSGNLGLGTASPSFNTGSGLEIERSGTATIRLQDSGNKSVELLQSSDFEIHCLNSAANVVINPTSNTIFETSSTERARIDGSGNLLVAATAIESNDGFDVNPYSGGIKVNIGHNGSAANGDTYIAFRRTGTALGSITQVSSTGVAYNTTSDARLKEVTGSARGLDVINNLNPVAYNWKADNKADEGLIAQEVEELVPNSVNQNDDGYYQMDYSKLVTHLVKGMQEQQEQIEKLKSQIADLRGE